MADRFVGEQLQNQQRSRRKALRTFSLGGGTRNQPRVPRVFASSGRSFLFAQNAQEISRRQGDVVRSYAMVQVWDPFGGADLGTFPSRNLTMLARYVLCTYVVAPVLSPTSQLEVTNQPLQAGRRSCSRSIDASSSFLFLASVIPLFRISSGFTTHYILLEIMAYLFDDSIPVLSSSSSSNVVT